MHTDVHRPHSTMRPLPMRLTSAITALSSQAFMLVRSRNLLFGNACLISSNIGPENDFSATVVGITDTLKMRAELAPSTALLRNVTASIDFVANPICGCKSIMVSPSSPPHHTTFPSPHSPLRLCYAPSLRP